MIQQVDEIRTNGCFAQNASSLLVASPSGNMDRRTLPGGRTATAIVAATRNDIDDRVHKNQGCRGWLHLLRDGCLVIVCR